MRPDNLRNLLDALLNKSKTSETMLLVKGIDPYLFEVKYHQNSLLRILCYRTTNAMQRHNYEGFAIYLWPASEEFRELGSSGIVERPINMDTRISLGERINLHNIFNAAAWVEVARAGLRAMGYYEKYQI